MIAVDTNILVYSHRPEAPFHARAKEIIESLRADSGNWAIPWPCLHEFIAVVTHPKVFAPATPMERAFETIESWGAPGNLRLIGEPESEGYLAKLKKLAIAGKIFGPRIHDTRIAAICASHGVSELWSCDRDFAAFSELKVGNPLKEGNH